MGYLRRSELLQAYNRIKRDAAGRTCSILIMAAPTELFKSDFIPYKVVPVAGYDDIVAANENFIQGRNEIRSVILLDCGATVDLSELLSVSPEIMMYLIDSHRPYSLFNIFDNSQILILDDGFIEENLSNLKHAFEATKFVENQVSEEEDSSDTELENEDESDGGARNENEVRNESQNENEVRNENRNENEVRNENKDPNTRKSKLERKAGLRYRDLCRQKYIEYYQDGTWYGTAVARMTFDIADSLSRHCNDLLWCSILGVTAQQLMEIVSNSSYESEISWLRERCLQLNRESNALPDATITNRDGRIKYEPEFRFMLTRHWTLFNSMLHSRYMATRLGVWKERGRRMLETFIVKMGVPLAQCKLDYSSMEMDLKETLPTRISRHAAEFGIEDVSIPSFIREFGFIMKLTASDAVYALMALIEAPYSATVYSNLSGNPIEDSSPTWVKNFYFAFDALDYQNIDKLKRGIELAMKQQQIILHEASTILSHRLLRYGRRFRYVVLRNSSDISWLANHPLSLAKLALFLSEATRQTRRGSTPLLLSAYQSQTDTFLVVSSHVANEGNELRNHFGMAFRRVAQMIRARVKHDGFDSSLIEVKAADLKKFFQTLQTISL